MLRELPSVSETEELSAPTLRSPVAIVEPERLREEDLRSIPVVELEIKPVTVLSMISTVLSMISTVAESAEMADAV